MPTRRADVFFYGLFMDPDLLRDRGLAPDAVETGSVSGFALRIGRRATLVPEPSGRVHGVVMSLTLAELADLYAEPSVREYRPQPVLVELAGGGAIAALCYTLPEPPPPSERDAEYARKLGDMCRKMGLPPAYIASLR